MRQFATFLIATLIFDGAAYAQARKCTAPDGRVTYSDVVCDNKAVGETRVNTNANTIDHSGMRAHVQSQLAAREAIKVDESLRMQRQAIKPQDCKFSYYALGDDKGKRLSDAAKAECQANNQAKLDGGPTSLEAYGFWRDHQAIKVTERQAAITRSEASARAAQAQINSIASPPPKLTCKPSIDRRSLECQ